MGVYISMLRFCRSLKKRKLRTMSLLRNSNKKLKNSNQAILSQQKEKKRSA